MTKEVLRMAESTAPAVLVDLLEGGYNLNLLGGSVRSHIMALM